MLMGCDLLLWECCVCMACMIGMLYRLKVINTVYSEIALARAVIAECLLVSSPHSDFSLMSPSWVRQLNRRRMRMRNARAYIIMTQHYATIVVDTSGQFVYIQSLLRRVFCTLVLFIRILTSV